MSPALLILLLTLLATEFFSRSNGFHYRSCCSTRSNDFVSTRYRNLRLMINPSDKTIDTTSKSTIEPLFLENQKDMDKASIQGIDIVYGQFDRLMLKNYWGAKPLLIRNAFDPTSDDMKKAWPTWDDILTLSCFGEKADQEWNEPGNSARLIRHVSSQLNSFDLKLGPFDRKHVDKIMKHKKKKWTILLNDVGRYHHECQYWMDRTFAFLPRWRRDDAQVSITTSGGGIGPHVDNYDVLLIQTLGTRDWEVNPEIILSVSEEYDQLIPNIPVRILNHRKKGIVLKLDPGDMLYLPPRIIHCGTASDNSAKCMTLSVGFRAPSAAELTARLAEYIQQSVSGTAVRRYTDSKIAVDGGNYGDSDIWQKNETSISSSVRSDLKRLVLSSVRDVLDDELAWDKLVGSVLTEATRYSENALRPYYEITDEKFHLTWGKAPNDVLEKVLQYEERYLIGCEGLSFASSTLVVNATATIYRLHAHGQTWEVWNDMRAAGIFQIIETGGRLQSRQLRQILGHHELCQSVTGNNTSSVVKVLLALIEHGVLRPDFDRPDSQGTTPCFESAIQ